MTPSSLPSRGVPSPEEMLQRMRTALAEAGYPDAHLEIGEWFGKGVTNAYDEVKAAGWPYSRACELAYEIDRVSA